MKNITRLITPLAKEDFFVVLYHPNANFDYPTHYHPEYELNYVENAKGKRIVGESIIEFDTIDLVLIGPNVYHSWRSETGNADLVITIQFHEDLLPENFKDKKILSSIKEMLEKSERGVLFSDETIHKIVPMMKSLIKQDSFNSYLCLLSILHELSVSKNQKVLCSQTFSPEFDMFKSRRIMLVCNYINNNYQNKVMIKDIANLIGMTNSSFCHFFKKRTGKSFVDYMNDVRIGHASIQLIETTKTIGEVCYNCGFINISNFNRTFKSKKKLTPSEFRLFNQPQIMKY